MEEIKVEPPKIIEKVESSESEEEEKKVEPKPVSPKKEKETK